MKPDPNVAFLDTETLGLDPDLHPVWEVGLLTWDSEREQWTEHLWHIEVDKAKADVKALQMTRFHARYGVDPGGGVKYYGLLEPQDFAESFEEWTRGLHVCGAVVSFDTDRLWRLLKSNHQTPMWHYHIIDCEALGVGYLAGRSPQDGPWVMPDGSRVAINPVCHPPWNSEDLSRALGVDPGQFDRHTALGDCRWARALYEVVFGDDR